VQRDRVRCDTDLAVREVPEDDAGDNRATTDAHGTSSPRHLPAKDRHRTAGAPWRGCLRDHRRTAARKDEVQVTVQFGPDEDHGGGDPEDVVLERQPRGRELARALAA
jgi:hypothetical protein